MAAACCSRHGEQPRDFGSRTKGTANAVSGCDDAWACGDA